MDNLGAYQRDPNHWWFTRWNTDLQREEIYNNNLGRWQERTEHSNIFNPVALDYEDTWAEPYILRIPSLVLGQYRFEGDD
jgi:hypothetical protein